MTFGEPGTEGARVHDIKDVEAILDIFRSHGHTEVMKSWYLPQCWDYVSWPLETDRHGACVLCWD